MNCGEFTLSALGIAALLLLFAGGLVALWAWGRCEGEAGRGGVWLHPAAGGAAFAFYIGVAYLAALKADAIVAIFFVWGIGWFYAPFFAYHVTHVLANVFATESQPPPEPEDPLERAKASEERGDVRGAIERYSWLLEREPMHVEARTRLAHLLARSRRLERAFDILREGVALEGVSEEARDEWRTLAEKWRRGEIVEDSPGEEGFRHAALGAVPTPRFDAYSSGRTEAPPGGPSAAEGEGRD
jgi:hypothetical protein